MSQWPIGVFTSLDAGLGVRMEVVADLKIPTIHLHSPHQGQRDEAQAKKFLAQCEEAGTIVSCIFCGFEGESYADIPTTAKTIGLVPEDLRAERAADVRVTAQFARYIGCNTLGMHVGFVPEDRQSASYLDLIQVMQSLLDDLAQHGQKLHLETGQETADHLLDFLNDVSRDNLFINFDPANMILYGTGNPIEALKKVGKHVGSIHCKDATWAEESVRGAEWGCEVALGEGDVNMQLFIQTLKEIGYVGPLTIEREIPEDPVQQKVDISIAAALLEKLRGEILEA